MITYHNCCIKLVPLVILIYDARSHIHQIYEDICLLCCTKKGLGITRNIITKNSVTRSLLHFNGTIVILKPHE